MSNETEPLEKDTFAELITIRNCTNPRPTMSEYAAIAELLTFVSKWRKKTATLEIKKSLETWPETERRKGWRLTVTICREDAGGPNE